jgi:hypothetical protein
MRRTSMFAAIGGASIALALVLILFVFSKPTRDYAIDVDPIKDSQNLFSTSRVTVANIGRLPITNILVSYGGNDNKSSERIASLLPGEKVLLSPPESSPLKSVTVTADQGLDITKGYRTPIKIPGMMGS